MKRWYKIHIFFTLFLRDEILVLNNVINNPYFVEPQGSCSFFGCKILIFNIIKNIDNLYKSGLCGQYHGLYAIGTNTLIGCDWLILLHFFILSNQVSIIKSIHIKPKLQDYFPNEEKIENKWRTIKQYKMKITTVGSNQQDTTYKTVLFGDAVSLNDICFSFNVFAKLKAAKTRFS